MLSAACGQQPASEADGGRGSAETADPVDRAAAPECHEVTELTELTAKLPDDRAPTGEEPEPMRTPPDMAGDAPLPFDRQIHRWGTQEDVETFAGAWFDEDLGGYVVALANDVDHYTQHQPFGDRAFIDLGIRQRVDRVTRMPN